MPAPDHGFVSLPLAIAGPVGVPPPVHFVFRCYQALVERGPMVESALARWM